ncbi:MAG: hypothetical protein LHV69_05045 [Elusimicrobia bacterium]|nr:hypothetical protein [Candidatus Obscuribacterium magneticum]
MRRSVLSPLRCLGKISFHIRLWLRLLFFGVAVCVFLVSFYQRRSFGPIDFYQYWVTGQALTSYSIDAMYSSSDQLQVTKEFLRSAPLRSYRYYRAAKFRAGEFQPAQTPFLFFFFHLVSTGQYDLDYNIFFFVSLLLFFTGFFIYASIFNLPVAAALLAYLLVVNYFGPFIHDCDVANLNTFQVGLLALLLLFRRSLNSQWAWGISGALLAFLLFLKPNAIYIALLLFFAWITEKELRRFSATMRGFLIMGLVAFLGPMFLFRSWHCWYDWGVGYANMVSGWLNNNFLCKLGVQVPSSVHWLMGGGLALPPSVILVWRRMKVKRSALPYFDDTIKRDGLMIGLGGVIYILSGQLIHYHYFVLVLPLIAFLLRFPDRVSSSWVKGLRPRHLVAISSVLFVGSSLTKWSFIGVLFLYVMGLWDLLSLGKRWRP